jgi:hypothetical protein
MQAGPCILMGTPLEKPEAGPASGPTWRLSRSGAAVDDCTELAPSRRPHAELSQSLRPHAELL